MLDAAELIGVPAGIVSTAIGLPQLHRIVARRDTSGVSLATWWLTACAGLTWVGHNVRHAETVAALTNGWSAIVAAAILHRCYTDRARPPRLLFLPAGVLLLDAAVLLTAPDRLGWVAAGIGLVQFLPQARTALLPGDLSGVSAGTWTLAVVAAALWATYGVLHDDAAIVVPPLVTGTVAIVILARLLRHRAAAG